MAADGLGRGGGGSECKCNNQLRLVAGARSLAANNGNLFEAHRVRIDERRRAEMLADVPAGECKLNHYYERFVLIPACSID
jgi:hypothetical protein